MAEPSQSSPGPINRHAPTPLDLQRAQLAKLLKDPAKPVNIPAAPSEKTIRPPREMMKNVQGSSAGAGSGEFHVYKQNRRREYERIKLMEEKHKKDAETEEFEQRRAQAEAEANAKTSKNRAKRQKRKERAKGGKGGEDGAGGKEGAFEGPIGKRRKVGGDGKQVVFRQPGQDDSDSEEEAAEPVVPQAQSDARTEVVPQPEVPLALEHVVTIHEDD